MSKIGIYSGSFDPIHLGHITFALQAAKAAKLEMVYFLPERQPRAKTGLEHFGHRVAMIRQAAKPHNQLDVIELEDKNFSVNKTLVRLQRKFPGKELVFLFGSDKVPEIMNWPNADKLFESSDIIIGLRQQVSRQQIKAQTTNWPKPSLKVISVHSPKVVSTEIRHSLSLGKNAHGLLRSVARYVKRHWLYVSLKDQTKTK